MKTKFNNLRKQQGFTIIEVMIVLAVAALIMLIVFLAVPALQRSAHNTQRTADATKITGAVNECLSNRNDTVASCNTDAALGLNAGGTANSGTTGTLDIGTLQQLTTVLVGAAAPSTVAFPSGNQTAYVYFGYTCTSAGDNFVSGSASQFAVLFNDQSSANGSIAHCVGG